MLLADLGLIFGTEQFRKLVEYSGNYSGNYSGHYHAEISIFHAETSAKTASFSAIFLSFASVAFLASL